MYPRAQYQYCKKTLYIGNDGDSKFPLHFLYILCNIAI